MKRIYLDNAASTPVNERVAKEMAKALKLYGNPSSYNNCGREAREYLDKARLKVAKFLGAHSDEIIFTSSGTEANNLAIQGIARKFQIPNIKFQTNSKLKIKKPHIITTKIEHLSVLEPVRQLEREGFDVTYLSIDKEGLVNLGELQDALRPETLLVSVMYANNEIGTIEPIVEIGKILKKFNKKLEVGNGFDGLTILSKSKDWKSKIGKTRRVLFHTDACQAVEYLDINTNHLGVDLLTFNGSKIYGPKGVGVLYVRRGVTLSPFLLGGEQEFGLRAGTENLLTIMGLAATLDGVDKGESVRLSQLRDYFIEKVKKTVPGAILNGALGNERLPNNINISVTDLTSEVLLLELDKHGICAGSGSACTSHSVEPSHVLKATGLDEKYLNGALRFSMGRQTTKKEMDCVLKVLPKVVRELRKRYKKI